jgi:hypothetical protein
MDGCIGWSKKEIMLNGCYAKKELIAFPIKGRMKDYTYFLALAKYNYLILSG